MNEDKRPSKAQNMRLLKETVKDQERGTLTVARMFEPSFIEGDKAYYHVIEGHIFIYRLTKEMPGDRVKILPRVLPLEELEFHHFTKTNV